MIPIEGQPILTAAAMRGAEGGQAPPDAAAIAALRKAFPDG